MLLKSLRHIFNQLSKFGSTISGKVTMLAFSLVVISAITIAVFFFQETLKTLAQKELENITHEVNIKSEQLKDTIKTLHDDVLFLSRTPPVQGIIRARKGKGTDPLDNSTEEEWIQRLSFIFSNFILSKPNYIQAQYIGISENGKELLRVERINEKVLTKEKSALQETGNMAYFLDAIKLGKNEVYLSNINLNRQYNEITTPYLPIMRAAVPIYAEDNTIFGIIIINMNFSNILKELLSSKFENINEYVTNHDGDILDDQHNVTNFGFEFNKQDNLLSIFPDIQKSYLNPSINTANFEVIKDNEKLLMYLQKVYYHPYDNSKFIGLTEAVSLNTIQDRIKEPINRIIILMLILIGTATLLALFLASLITKPLKNIITAIEEYGKHENHIQLPKDADGEVGILAQAFSTMVDQVNMRREKLNQNEAYIRSVIDNAPDGIITINNLGLVRSYNPGAENIFGYSQNEIIGKDAKLLVSDSFVEFNKKCFREYSQSPEGKIIYSVIEANGIHKDGSIVPVEISLSETTLNNQPIFIASVRDISRRKRIENQLKLSAKVMDTAIEAIMITDEDNKIQMVNPAFEHITGYSLDDIKDKTPEIFESDEHDKSFYQRIWNTVRETGAWKGELWVNRKNGDVYPKWMSISSIHDESGKITHHVGIFSDITERKLAEKRLEHLANYDPLTDLPNRRLFHDRLDQAIQRANRKKSQFGLLFLDIDHFKVINDTQGHNIGDQLLVEVADRLHITVRKSDTVARLAGDEFTVILESIDSAENACHVAQTIVTELSKPFKLGGRKHFSGVSIGISLYPRDGTDPETLLKHADVAMYHAKEKGRNNFQQYQESMSTSIIHRLQLETQLRHALEHKDFVLHFQPQFDVNSNEIVGAEALIRWKQSDGSLIFPDTFIPTAEETKLILPIGDLVIEEACKQHAQWNEKGLGKIRISVNVSANQLNHRNTLPFTVKRLLNKYQMQAKYLELEFTESVLIEQNPHTTATLNGLQQLGCPLSLDDFGTGYASLSQLKRLPFRVIKIDRSFIKDIAYDQDSIEIVRAIIAMSKSLKRIVIAEGVENEEQLACLRELNCDQVQGYLFSKAIPGDDFSTLLEKK